ncbi:MAG: hypothetical protein WA919_07950 [Coleofasciculaceae cyanobacterium]
MKKQSQPNLNNLQQTLVQDLTDEQANQVTGGLVTSLVLLFYATNTGRLTSPGGNIEL